MNEVVSCIALGVVSLTGCGDDIHCEEDICPCTEKGLRHAVGEGGGPYRFDCGGPTTVVTGGEIVIDRDVILEGDGNLTLNGNEAHRVLNVAPGVTATLSGVAITGGYVETHNGGGIVVGAGASLTLEDSVVFGNTATYSGTTLLRGTGGGIYSRGALTLNGSTVAGNTASWNGADGLFVRGGRGGGIDNEGGTVLLIDSTVEDNTATHWGGGILNRERGTLTLETSRVSGNSARYRGGGIANESRVILKKSSVSTNTADHGGGIYNLSDAELTVTDSTVADNAASYTGGGIRGHIHGLVPLHGARDDKSGFDGGTLTLTNSTVSGNSADYGGALYLDSGSLTLTSSTIAGDVFTGSGDPEGSFLELSVHVEASIANGRCEHGSGQVTWQSGGYNIESPGDTCGFREATDQVSVSADDLGLGPLQDNGGPTATRAVRASSVAVDAIPEESCLDGGAEPRTADQRGEPRPETGGTMCDVGAFEAQP